MSEKCALCRRQLYDVGNWDEAIEPYRRGPFGSLYAEQLAEFDKHWAWRSKWVPELCRQCDTEHDHRRSPSLWYRLKRRLEPSNRQGPKYPPKPKPPPPYKMEPRR